MNPTDNSSIQAIQPIATDGAQASIVSIQDKAIQARKQREAQIERERYTMGSRISHGYSIGTVLGFIALLVIASPLQARTSKHAYGPHTHHTRHPHE